MQTKENDRPENSLSAREISSLGIAVYNGFAVHPRIQFVDPFGREICRSSHLHTFLWGPYSCNFIDANGGQLLPVAVPGNMGHGLRTRHTVVARFEGGERWRLRADEFVAKTSLGEGAHTWTPLAVNVV